MGVKKLISQTISKWKLFFGTISSFLPHIQKQSSRLILSVLSGLGYVICGMLEPWPLKLIFDNVFYQKKIPKIFSPFLSPYLADKFLLLNILIGSIIVIALIRGVFYYYQQILTSAAAQQIITAIRLDLYTHLQKLSFSFHDRRKTGDMISRLTADMRILRDMFVTLPLTITSELFLMIAMVIVMAFMDWELTLLSLLSIPLLGLLIKKYRKPLKQEMQMQREREGHITNLASEVLNAIKVVQGYHREDYEIERFGSQNTNSLKNGVKATRLEAKLRWGSELVVAVVTALVLAVAGRRVMSGILSPGDLLVFAYYLRTFNRPLRRISKLTELVSRGGASGERILSLIEVKPLIQDKPGAIEIATLRGDICFQQVNFCYENDGSCDIKNKNESDGSRDIKNKNKNESNEINRDNKHYVLNDINLRIEAGEKVAIIGHTGSGKSTLVSLLPRFYEPTSGRVTIDGIDVSDFTIRSLRQQISIVFQEPILFATTIAENISYGKPGATREEIVQAAKKAHIHHIIESLPDGYDTILGERGGTLSGGQRQCVAIARSMIKDAPIIILDEPTSGLDIPSAMLVMEALEELMKGKTVIVISHQRDTLCGIDRLIEIKNGRIVDSSAMAVV